MGTITYSPDTPVDGRASQLTKYNTSGSGWGRLEAAGRPKAPNPKQTTDNATTSNKLEQLQNSGRINAPRVLEPRETLLPAVEDFFGLTHLRIQRCYRPAPVHRVPFRRQA